MVFAGKRKSTGYKAKNRREMHNKRRDEKG